MNGTSCDNCFTEYRHGVIVTTKTTAVAIEIISIINVGMIMFSLIKKRRADKKQSKIA